MKIKNYISILIFSFISLSCSITSEKYSQYHRKIVKLNASIVDSDLDNLFSYYYKKNQSYPKTIDELIISLEADYSHTYLQQLLIDPYRGNNDSLAYCPIYDKLTQKPVSYLFLSTAEDKNFDSNTLQILYTDDWFKKIKAYNLQDIINEMNKTVIEYPYADRERSYISICVKDELIKSGKVAISGDSVLSRETIYNQLDDGQGTFDFVFYPEYISKRENGNSDFIVAVGRKRIKYKLIKSSAL